MATTSSTQVRYVSDGRIFKPTIARVANVASISSGVGNAVTYSPIETLGYSVARLTAHIHALDADTTVTLQVQSGPTSAAVTENARTSSNAPTAVVATTGVHTRTFTGLDRWSKVIAFCAGAGDCTGISIDLELI